MSIFSILLVGAMAIFTFHAIEKESERITLSMKEQAQVLASNLAATSADHLLTRDYTAIELMLLRSAKFAGIILPGRARLFHFRRAFFNGPAGFLSIFFAPHSGKQKKQLSFHVGGHLAPALFIAVDRFQRGTQQLGHLFLSFIQLGTEK